MSEQALAAAGAKPAEAKPAEKPQPISPNFLKFMKGGSDAVTPAAETPPKAEDKPADKPEDKPADKPAEKPAEPAAAQPNPEDKPADKPEDKPTKKKVVVSKKYENAVDPVELAKKTGEAMGKELADALRKTEKAKTEPEPEDVEFNREEQHQLKVLAKLEEIQPDNYKGISGRFKKAVAEIAKLDAGRDSWMERNSGKYDAAEIEQAWKEHRAGEHERILDRNKVEWDQLDFDDARIALATEPITKELTEAKKKLERYEQKTVAEEIKPKAKAAALASAKDIGRGLLGEEGSKIITDNLELNKENKEKIEEADPVAAPIITDAMARAANFSAAVEEVFHGTATKEVVNAVGRFCTGLEQQIKSMPHDQQMWNGRRFATLDDYYAMKKSEREAYWTLDPDFVRSAFNDDLLEQAKAAITEERARFERISKRNGTPPAKPAAEPKKEEKPVATKPVSPTTGSASAPPVSSGAAKPAAAVTGGGKFFNFLRNGSS